VGKHPRRSLPPKDLERPGSVGVSQVMQIEADGSPRTRWRVAGLIADLDSDHFADRDGAGKALASLGNAVVPELRRALKGKPSPEAARRLRQLLEGSEGWPAEELRAWRALEVLERIGTDEARQVLQGLADGPAGARLAQGAKDSLGRLSKLAARPADTHPAP
jgi:hypothetical protein